MNHDEQMNDILKMEAIGRKTIDLFNIPYVPGKSATFKTYFGEMTLLEIGRTIYQITNNL